MFCGCYHYFSSHFKLHECECTGYSYLYKQIMGKCKNKLLFDDKIVKIDSLHKYQRYNKSFLVNDKYHTLF